MNNIDKFNALAGTLFGKLYESFPQPLEVSPKPFEDELSKSLADEDLFSFEDYFASTIRWLEKAGYLWVDADKTTYDGPSYDVVLAPKGFEALRRVPDSLEGTATLGERLVEFSKSKTSEAIGSLISLAITTAFH